MASDEIVWQVINNQFCAFKIKSAAKQNFCRNEYNVSGLCNRQSCPLANSKYATIRASPDTGVLYLYMKVAERAHLPSKMWERIRLPQNYNAALEMIDKRLIYWPKFLIHKAKQRLTRLHQVAIRSRKLTKEQERLGETLVPKLAPKVRRREATRERKSEAAAKIERALERELLDRLRSGAYGDRPLNVEEGIWKRVLKGLERSGEGEKDEDLDEGIEEEEEEYEDGLNDVEYVSDIEGDEEDEENEIGDLEEWIGDSEDEASPGESDEDETGASDSDGEEKPKAGQKRKPAAPPPKPKKKRPRMEIEYEEETVAPQSIRA